MGIFGGRKKNSTEPAKSTGTVTLDDGESYVISEVVDCIGDSCPRPQLSTKKAVSHASPGAVIEVMIDNPTSMEAIPPLMPELGGLHLGTIRAERHWRVIVKKN